MNDDGAVFDLLGFTQRRHQRAGIVTINIPDVLESQFVHQRARQHRGGDRVLNRLGRVMQALSHGRNREQGFFHFIFEAMIAVRFANAI